MVKHNVQDIRNVAFCGHGSSGKTTLVDRLLVKTGAVNANPSVDDGTSICDLDPEEKHHKYTIETTLVHLDYNGKYIQALDTPGYPDFIGQTVGALHGVDLAAIVINAQSGIEVNTRRVFNEAGKLGLGRMIVISKLDADNINFPRLVESVREMWGSSCVFLNVPVGVGHDFKGVVSTLHPPENTAGALLDPNGIRGPLTESIIEVDEEAMMLYLEGTSPTDELLSRLIVKAVAAGKLIPIVCCSARAQIGLTELLDAICFCGPSPADIERKGIKEDQEVVIKPDSNGPLVAQVFRTRIDPFVQKLSFMRVFSGILKKDMNVHASGVRRVIKMGPLLRIQAGETTPIDEAGPGELVAVAKMEDLHTGTTLGDYTLPPIKFPRPMVGLAVSPKTRGDETKLSSSLHKILEEDPTFHLERDSQTKELVMTGMTELHLTIVRERLARRDKLEVETKEP